MCQVRVECQVRVSYKSVKQECQVRVSQKKRQAQECQVRVPATTKCSCFASVCFSSCLFGFQVTPKQAATKKFLQANEATVPLSKYYVCLLLVAAGPKSLPPLRRPGVQPANGGVRIGDPHDGQKPRPYVFPPWSQFSFCCFFFSFQVKTP